MCWGRAPGRDGVSGGSSSSRVGAAPGPPFPGALPLLHLVSLLSPQREQTRPRGAFLLVPELPPVPRCRRARGAAAPALRNHRCRRAIGAIDNHQHLPIGTWPGHQKQQQTHLGWADITNHFSPGHRWPAETPRGCRPPPGT